MIPGRPYTPELVLQIAWRLKWWIVLPAIAIATATAAWTYRLPDRYRADALILVVPQRVPEAYVRSTVTTRIEDRLQAITQQIMSRTRLERIIQDLNLYPEARKTAIMEDIVESMRSNIDTPIVRGDAFRVSFTSEDPRTAMRVAERLASMFIDESLRDREVLAEGTNQFLEAQLEDARRQLIDNEKKLEDYRRLHDGQLPTQLEANMQGVHNTEMELQSLLESANRDRDRHLVLERMIADAEVAESLVAPPPVVAGRETAAEQLHAAQELLRGLELRLKPEHPDIVRSKRLIAELQERADAEAAARPVSSDAPLTPAEAARRNRLEDLKTELGNLDKQVEAKTAAETRLRGILAEYQRRIESTPTRVSELADLTRDYGTLQGAYLSLLAKKQDSQISANLERRQIGEQFRILDPARLPTRPFTPNRPRFYSMGLFGGIAFGLALAGLFEYVDRRMRSEEDVRAVINVPVLATIPLIHESAPLRRKHVVAIAVSAVATILVGAAAIAWRILR